MTLSEKDFNYVQKSIVEVQRSGRSIRKIFAAYYDEDVDNAVAGMTSLIEPVMIVFLAVAVGFIVIALFLPIVAIIETIGK